MKIRKKEKPFFAGDIIVYLTILILAAGSFLVIYRKPSGGGLAAVVTQDGAELYSINLKDVSDRMEFEVPGRYNARIVAENQRIRFEQADCPDQICVNTGWISRPGQVAVCVPAGIILKITGDSGEEETDFYLK